MKEPSAFEMITQTIKEKSSMKQDVYTSAVDVFNQFKEVLRSIASQLNEEVQKADKRITVEFTEKGEFEAELHFGGDILIFFLHTNVFKFDDGHSISKTPYVQEDDYRRYCGIISIYNFLADSVKYNRSGDLGYMIARVFVNKEKHYCVEGKRQLGFLYNDFESAELKEDGMRAIIESAILYTLEFDLLTPPYDHVKEVTVNQLQETTNFILVKTAKRMGFTFQSDNEPTD